MSRVRSLGGAPPPRRAGDRSGAVVQPVQRTVRSPEVPDAPRGWRDPWLVTGVVVAAVLALGWRNNPTMDGTTVPALQRVAQILVSAGPVLALLAWMSAILRTRPGGSTWGPIALVAAGGVWVLLLGIVLVLHGAQGDVCTGLPRCTTALGARLALGAVLGATWIGARLLDGVLVRRRAGAPWRAPVARR